MKCLNATKQNLDSETSYSLEMVSRRWEGRDSVSKVRDLKNDPTWRLAGRIAARVYVELGRHSVPLLQRAIDKALLEEKSHSTGKVETQ